MDYKLAGRSFSRLWRRGKLYSDHEIRWLARKRGLEAVFGKESVQLRNKKGASVVEFTAITEKIAVPAGRPADVVKLKAYASLRFGLLLLLWLPGMSHAQTHQEMVVAAVLMAECRGEGDVGMEAVCEVIHQRCLDKHSMPLAVVTAHRGRIHAFSCLNGTTTTRLIRRYELDPEFQMALAEAKTTCLNPGKLKNYTKRATHYTRKTEKPRWAKDKKPVAIIGNHAFYKMARY